jgi:serine/threonine protein kinase
MRKNGISRIGHLPYPGFANLCYIRGSHLGLHNHVAVQIAWPLVHIGKYEILSELGRGGMGVVYRARDPQIGRLVAVKTISRELAGSRELLERFLQEAQAAGRLQHPNIVTIYDVGEADGVAYIVMEYLEGHTLERVISRAMNLRLVHKIRYILEVCRGLQFAHRRQVIHRDIKPSNIFITLEGVVKILDFGIARLTDPSINREQTRTGLTIGTMDYMSPEQVRGEVANAATDIWAVGVTAYELLSYEKPFNGESTFALLTNIINKEPKPLRELVPNCPLDLELLVARMLRKDVKERYSSMDELLPGLERIYKNLADLSVRELLNLSEDCIKSNDASKAIDVLREVLQIDAANVEAKNLLEEAQVSLKDQSVTARLESHVEKANALLGQGDLPGARKEAEAANRIDPGYEPAHQLLEQLDHLDHRSETINRLLKEASAKLANREFGSLEQIAKQILALQADNQEAQRLVQQAREQNRSATSPTIFPAAAPSRAQGVTALNVLSPPTGFFGQSVVSRTRFFEGDQVRYKKIQETLKFYRDHLNGEYQSLSNQAKFTYYLWIASVILGLAALVSGVILLFMKQFAAGSVSAISTTFVYFIQRVFQQREDHYRSLATAKHEHLEYGNHWLLVIQSIDAIENPAERERRQSELVNVMTRKLDTSSPHSRSSRVTTPRRKKTKPVVN